MADSRWSIKGTDPETIDRFRAIHREYEKRTDEDITQEDTLAMLIEGVDVQPSVDYAKIRSIIQEEAGTGECVSNEDLQRSINDVSDDVDTVIERMP